MTQFLSNLSKTAKIVPQSYVLPKHIRPKMDAPICKENPIIDLSLAMSSNVHDRAEVAEKLLQALDDGCGFQVINHGVSETFMEDAMEVYKELFNLPVEEKVKLVSDSTNSSRTGLYTGAEDIAEKTNLWKDTIDHICYPLEEHIESWPEKPPQYRKVIAEYVNETRKLTENIFELVAEGLGIEKQCFDGKFTNSIALNANYYPKSPDPSLTTGLWVHYDPNVVTLIQQNVSGLQILKDEQWVVVEPIPNAFFVNPGIELQIFSNGRFKALQHQVATNANFDRLSISMFMFAAPREIGSKPENAFLSDENPAKYKNYSYEKYLKVLQMKCAEDGSEISMVAACRFALDSFLI